ncbi:acyltransferase [Spirochaetota bacterium]
MSWLKNEHIQQMNFSSIGKDVMLSEKASFYNCENIRIGDNVRVDDFCVLSAGDGGIDIGNNIHIGVFSALIGGGNILLCDFCGLSSRVVIYSSNEDYSGVAMTNPTIPAEFKNVQHLDVKVGRHVIIGTGSIILPGVTLEEGVAVGALSLVKNNCHAFGIYIGAPAKQTGERKRDLLELEKKFYDIKSST